jgi:RNA polymerase sigma factor (TIGR02999 family)
MFAPMTDVTRLLDAAAAGDRRAAADLLPLVYDELRQLAAARMADERPEHTLQPTALVHEAYLRLVGDQQFEHRGHFFAAAAEAMRRILVDHARRKGAHKRGGAREPLDLDPATFPAPERPDDLLALDEALELLGRTEPQVAELVKLRYFAGITIPQAAEALGVSPRTADAWWAYARAWLLAKLQGETV